MGISGNYSKPGPVDVGMGDKFKAPKDPKSTAIWSLYWDFSWFGPNNALPPSGFLGAHVKLFVQLEDQSASAVYYPPETDELVKATQPGDAYFYDILVNLRRRVQYNPDTMSYGFSEPARKLGNEWRGRVVAGPPPGEPAQWNDSSL